MKTLWNRLSQRGKTVTAVVTALLVLTFGFSMGQQSDADTLAAKEEATASAEALQLQNEELAAQVELLETQLAEKTGEVDEALLLLEAAQTELATVQNEHDSMALALNDAEARNLDLEQQQTTAPQPPPAAEAPVAEAEPPAPAATGGGMVWIPRTSSKYHSSSSCSNMKNPSQMTLEQAIASGYGQCSKCW